MRSRRAVISLLEKEWLELVSARAFWVLLVAMGPLVGVSFISAAHTYAEVSGLNGTAAGVGEALSPLIGVWAPTFSACELAAVFLLPFVAIRMVAGDRQSGALRLELQQAMSPLTRIAAKALILLAGWGLAMLIPLSAVLLWKLNGGTVYLPEIAATVAGHVLNAGLAIALAAAMASLTEHPSTAAILTLTFTTGTWIVDFFAAVRGGWWERAAAYTPTAMVAEFQHGLVRLDAVLATLALIVTGLGVAAIWMRLGVTVGRRVWESAAMCAMGAALVMACTLSSASRDLSENRGNSFSRADEQALRAIQTQLRIEVHLAQEDPRRADLEHHALQKLRRVMPRVEIQYVAASSIGLFEQNTARYGEIWYELGGRKEMSRVTTEEGVLETIYTVAGVTPGAENREEVFRGHPMATEPRYSGFIFYLLWPALLVGSKWMLERGGSQ